jgi:hypothetical protein
VVLGLVLATALAGCSAATPEAAATPTAINTVTSPTATVSAVTDANAGQLSANGLFRASFTVAEAAVPVNKLHTWTLHVETAGGEPVDDATIAVDGDMPAHGHGLPTRPEVTQALGNGDYLVEGMKFQMGGLWVIDFDITVDGQTDRVSFELQLPE